MLVKDQAIDAKYDRSKIIYVCDGDYYLRQFDAL